MKPISKKDFKKIEKMAEKAEKKEESDNLILRFQPTKKVEDHILFDDENQLWLPVKNSLFQKGAGNVYRYRDIMNFERIENINTIVTSSGFQSTPQGDGPLKTQSESTASQMLVKILLNDVENPLVEIPLITSKVSTSAAQYRQASEESKELMSALAMAQKMAGNQPDVLWEGESSVADELMKLRDLLESGALTPEEFEEQKERLLTK